MQPLIIMLELEPNLNILYPDAKIEHMITIATTIVEADKLKEEKKALGIALLSLDLLSYPTRSNIKSQKIGKVEESYYNSGVSKWRELYNSLVNETLDNEISINYVGI